MTHHKLRKTLLIVLIVVVTFIIVVVAFISPITKYLVEKYSVKYTGRQIKMNWAYVNPFTGNVYFDGLKIYESRGDSLFITANSLSVRFALFKLLNHTFEISSITLDKPVIRIIQNKKIFNFSDIIDKFSSKGEKKEPSKNPMKVNVENMRIYDGEFHYIDQTAKVNYFIKKTDLKSDGVFWNNDTLKVNYFFESGIGSGSAQGLFTINFKTVDYSLTSVIHKFDLKVLEQYLHDLSNYGKFTAFMDADLRTTGNFKNVKATDITGILTLNDFHIGKRVGDDYASFDKMVFQMKEVSPKKHRYFLDSLSLVHPYFLYERYDHLNNLEKMFGEQGSKISAVKSDPTQVNIIIEIANYIKNLAENFFNSDFKVDRIAIYKADIRYNDYSLQEKFSIDADPLYIISDSIYKNHDRVQLMLRSGVKPYGSTVLNLSMNPRYYGDFNLNYHINDIPVPLFNPFIITYTSFPFDRGTVDFNGNWNVKNGIIESSNHMLVVDPYTGKRIKSEDAKWLPMPLIMAFVRERGGVIDYQIPITGDLKNPHFNLWDAILKVLTNIFIKPPTIPYGIQVSNTEEKINNLPVIKWPTGKAELKSTQEKFVKKIVKFIKKNTGFIAIYPVEYTEREKEHILLFEGKKKYYMQLHKLSTLNEDDSDAIDKMSIKDSNFTHYLDKNFPHNTMFTAQEKCDSLLGKDLINVKYVQLIKAREKLFKSYFEKENVGDRVKFFASESSVPYDGFSYYKIKYDGKLPEELQEAYEEMVELNNGMFRKKYKNIRKEIHTNYEKESKP